MRAVLQNMLVPSSTRHCLSSQYNLKKKKSVLQQGHSDISPEAASAVVGERAAKDRKRVLKQNLPAKGNMLLQPKISALFFFKPEILN